MSLATEARDAGIDLAAENAGAQFRRLAGIFVLRFLLEHGPSSGEAITDACMAAGIVPENDGRAFGSVFWKLSRRGLIERVGECRREKGNASHGGSIWSLTTEGKSP